MESTEALPQTLFPALGRSRSAYVLSEFAQHRAVLIASEATLVDAIEEAADRMAHALRQGGKILLFGNGGSAADAQHIAAELLIRYQSDRPALAAIALTTDSSTLTACGNDYGFDAIFERQIAGLARPSDLAIGISTSGKSANVIRGLQRAKALGIVTIGLIGGTGGLMREFCDVAIVVPSKVTARIQELHILIGHVLCGSVEAKLGHGS